MSMPSQHLKEKAGSREPRAHTAAWLLLLYQIPATPSNLRVKTWRRLQKIGAVPVKNSAYALPNSPQAREDFEWMRTEILAMNGQGAVFTAEHLDEQTGREIVAAFQTAREKEFRALRSEVLKATASAKRAGSGSLMRRRLESQASGLRERFAELEARDAFGVAARAEAKAALERLERFLLQRAKQPGHAQQTGGRAMQAEFRNRVWVTRPRPGVDRMSSAWLIRRFIDPKAKFAFAETVTKKSRAIPFDMFGVEFSHHGDGCTFETLTRRFGIQDPAVERIGQIVHNLDLKEEKFNAPEAAAIGKLVEGMRQLYPSDPELLAQGIQMFDALYRSISGTPPGARQSTKSGRTRKA